MNQTNVKEERDEDEISLDDDDNDEDEEDNQVDDDVNKQEDEPATAAAAALVDVAAQEEVREEDPPKQPAAAAAAAAAGASVAMSKSAGMKQRLRQLKQKMNQARHLNQQAVKQEGERMGSHEAQLKEKRRLRATDKQSAAQHLASTNAKALQMAAEHNIDAKYLLQQASESVQKANARLESQERNQYSVNDTYNPEGHHRKYQNSLKQLPRGKQQHSTDRLQETFDPLQHQVAVAAASGNTNNSATTSAAGGIDDDDNRPFLNVQQERHGARRLAQEMHRRMEHNKKKEGEKKRKQEIQEEQQHEDVGYINPRNKRFNQKINRTYGKDTAEIKQNLERGTAL